MNQKQTLLQSLKQRGFSKRILDAFSEVERENFIVDSLKNRAYEDIALSIGEGQTISQPYTVAVMFSLLELRRGQKVLEIGSGCGYVLALLSKMVGEKGKVYGMEILKELFDKSKNNLKGYSNVKIYNRSGFEGLKEKALFDRIIISAGCEEIPKSLAGQLKDRGIIIAPVGATYDHSLITYKKINGNLRLKEKIPGFAFVPFVDVN